MERISTLALVLALAGCGSEEPAQPPAPAPAAAAPAPAAEPPAETEPEVAPEAEAPEESVGLVGLVPATIRVSSAAGRDPDATVRRLFDGEMETAWSTEKGDLEGAFVSVDLPDGVVVTGVALTAGYVKESRGRDLFTANQRLKTLRVVRHDEEVARFDLDLDSRALQTFPLEGRGGEWRFEVAAVEDGSHEGWEDVSLSELQVMGRPGSAETTAPESEVHVVGRPFEQILAGLAAVEPGHPVAGRPLQTFFGAVGSEAQTRKLHFADDHCHRLVGRFRPSDGSAPSLEGVEATLTIAGTEEPLREVPGIAGAFTTGPVCLAVGRQGTFAIRGPAGTFAASLFGGAEEDAQGNWSMDAVGEPGVDPDAGPFLGSAAGIELTEMAVAQMVMDGEALGRTTYFHPEDTSDRVYCQVRLRNTTGQPTEIHIAYEPLEGGDGGLGPSYDVPARERYVTFSYRGTHVAPGRYRCVVRAANGELLGMQAYDILSRDG